MVCPWDVRWTVNKKEAVNIKRPNEKVGVILEVTNEIVLLIYTQYRGGWRDIHPAV